MSDTDRLRELGRKLADPNPHARGNAAWEITQKYSGEDLLPIVPALWKALEDPHSPVAAYAAAALAHQVLITGEWDALLMLLNHKREWVRRAANHSTVGNALTVYLYSLQASLSEPVRDSHWFKASVLRLETLTNISRDQVSCFQLEGLQKSVEKFLFELQKRLPAPRTPQELQLRLELKQSAIALFQRIAERKTIHVRETDGKLLMGETIPNPRDRKSLYRLQRTAVPR